MEYEFLKWKHYYQCWLCFQRAKNAWGWGGYVSVRVKSVEIRRLDIEWLEFRYGHNGRFTCKENWSKSDTYVAKCDGASIKDRTSPIKDWLNWPKDKYERAWEEKTGEAGGCEPAENRVQINVTRDLEFLQNLLNFKNGTHGSRNSQNKANWFIDRIFAINDWMFLNQDRSGLDTHPISPMRFQQRLQ